MTTDLRAAWRTSREAAAAAQTRLDAMRERLETAETREQDAHAAYDAAHARFEAAAGALATGDVSDDTAVIETRTDRRMRESDVLEAEAGTRAVRARVEALEREHASVEAAACAAGIAYAVEAARVQSAHTLAVARELAGSHRRWHRLARAADALSLRRARALAIVEGRDPERIHVGGPEPVEYSAAGAGRLDPDNQGAAGLPGVLAAAALRVDWHPVPGEIDAMSDEELLALPEEPEGDAPARMAPAAARVAPAAEEAEPADLDDDIDDDIDDGDEAHA